MGSPTHGRWWTVERQLQPHGRYHDYGKTWPSLGEAMEAFEASVKRNLHMFNGGATKVRLVDQSGTVIDERDLAKMRREEREKRRMEERLFGGGNRMI